MEQKLKQRLTNETKQNKTKPSNHPFLDEINTGYIGTYVYVYGDVYVLRALFFTQMGEVG